MSNHLNWASTLIRSLYKSGVRHAVISPGSRSTPLTLAAAIHHGIKKSIVLDERSAGFIALGIGKATGLPAVLICTSGTAAANYLPAIVEAKQSGLPMIVLTADRPPNLHGIGSSQTIDQIKLYGDSAVHFHEAGEPRFEDQDLKRINYLGKQAVRDAIQLGGAVHINMPFRKPLEPDEDQIVREKKIIDSEMNTSADHFLERPVDRNLTFNKEILSLINSSKKPLMICGPANPHQSLAGKAIEMAEFLKAPVIAEPGSGVSENHTNTLSRYEQFLNHEKATGPYKPDLILRFGDQPFTKSIIQSLDSWAGVPVIHFSSRKPVQDHSMNVRFMVECFESDSFAYSEMKCSTDDGWTGRWKELELDSENKLGSAIEQTEFLTDGNVLNSISKQLNGGLNCMLSNSFIPRDMAMFGKTHTNQFVNRGAAGIDGILSTGIGILLATGKKTVCITGDLAFLHDSNALLSLKAADNPLIIFVINNGGGTIFNMLPVSNLELYFEDYFITPQQVHIGKLAEAHQVNYLNIQTIEELESVDISSIATHTIVECVTNSDESMKLRKTLWNS